MAQWQELLNIDSEHQNQVIQVYAHQNFPLELRRIASVWIEAQDWKSVAEDEKHARACYHELLCQVEEQHSRLVQQNNILGGPNYLQLVNNARALFQADPVDMARIISRCLSEERKIITSTRANLQECQIELDDSIIELQKRIQMADLKIKSIDEQFGKHDSFLKLWQDEVEQLNGSPVSPKLQTMKMSIDQMLEVLNQARLDVCYLIGNTLKLAELVVSRVVDEELRSWKVRQQQACIGAPIDTSLHKLQNWFMVAALALDKQQQQLRKLPELDLHSPPRDLLSLRSQCEQTAHCLFTRLLKNALVVEKQPMSSAQRPLILKTGVRFSVKTRFLVNHSSFNWMPKVTLKFNKDFDEIGAGNGFRKFNFNQKGVSKLMDAEKTGLVAQFERLVLVEEKYKSNRQNESLLAVTEELHFITCVMELKLPGLTLDVETSTLPLVVISSTIQSHGAWASILWSAMAADQQPKNQLFLTPPTVTWPQLSEVLSWQFQATGERGLDEQQLAMLKDKFVDETDGLVTWNKFYKCDATWVWIEGILYLIKNHLLSIWRDGHIMGFISRDSAIMLLKDKPAGTFLLRFSETKEGAITFSWVDRSTGAARVHAVEPYKKELSISNLADILRHYRLTDPSSRSVNPLLYLYPDIPRDQAFGKYYTKPAGNSDGYVLRNSGHWSVHPTPPPSPEENRSMESSLNNMDSSLNNMDFSMNNMDTSLSNMDPSFTTMDPSINIYSIIRNMDLDTAMELFPELSDMGGPLHGFHPLS